MAVTIVEEFKGRLVAVGAGGDLAFAVLKVQLDSNYPVGGYTLSLQKYASHIMFIFPVLTEDNVGGFSFSVDDSNFSTGTALLELKESKGSNGPHTELTASDDLSGTYVRIMVIGQK